MKKICFFLFMAAVSSNLVSQVTSANVVFKTKPLELVFGNINLVYEKPLNGSSSLVFKSRYAYRFFGKMANVFGASAGYRYYFKKFTKQLPSGFYVNPELAINSGSFERSNFGNFLAGTESGYQWAIGKRFVLDVGIGSRYLIFFGNHKNIYEKGPFLDFDLELAVGYAF